MAQQYSKAPVVEAIIDIRVASPKDILTLDLADALRHLNADYPYRELLAPAPAFQMSSTDGFSAAFGMGSLSEGLRYRNQQGSHIFQARNDGFTLSVLPPYGTWEEFRAEAIRLWNTYVDARQPELYTRVAVRYVNRFEIPSKDRPLSEYFTLFPAFDSQLGHLSDFQTRHQFPQPDLEANLFLTQATLAPNGNDSSFTSVLLDIDLFRDKMGQRIEFDVWNLMEQLRERKNLVFESCITELTRRLIR